MKIKVTIIDGDPIARRFFEMKINSQRGYEAVLSLPSVSSESIDPLNLHTDAVIVDMLTCVKFGIEKFATYIREKNPNAKVIAVASIPEYSWLKRARVCGFDSFWYKNSENIGIDEVLDRTMRGESVYPEKPHTVMLGLADSSEFTLRELEVLKIITSGDSNAEVAQALGISENTVKVHVRNMLVKTGFKSRTELAIKARVKGITIPD